MGGYQMKILIEDQMAPIGLDEKKPAFSWLLTAEEGEQNLMQSACRIVVRTGEDTVWDSGKMETGVSTGIGYEGEALQPCTKYEVKAEVWDNHGGKAEAESSFETGLMDSLYAAWEGAEWIGAPHATVCAENRGVFTIESEFRIEGGKGEAGIVFGANDFRLNDHTKNELGMEGENYIRYAVCLEDGDARLEIYRVGYAPEDTAEKPFAVTKLVNWKEKTQEILTPENADAFHKLTVEVDGNVAYAYVDGILVDAIEEHGFFGTKVSGRQLNPRGDNDVLPYPRLNEIGFYAGKGTTGYFKNLTVRNVRKPSAEIVRETPEGRLDGGKSIFADQIPVENGYFKVEDSQITADPSHHSIPMLRSCISCQKEKKLASARLYITARGIYDCRINGQEITKDLLRPGLTQYDHRMNYQTYDITGLMKPGRNGIGVTLASGWWSEAQTFVVKNFNYFGDKESLLAKVVMKYEDGSREVFGTNTEDWKYFGEGPYLFSSYFAGEQYDARRAEVYETYSLPEFDDSTWEKPVVVDTVMIEEFCTMPGFGRSWPAVHEQKPEYIGEYDAPVRIVDRRTAKTRKELFPGVYLYDLEQEMAGVPRITLHEKAGTKIIIRYAEVLYPDLPEYAGKEGTMMLENYRDATSTDVYICRGGEEVFQPKFTFHGYRYIEISGVEHAPELEEVESLQYSSVTEFHGSLTSSHKLLNRFAENVSWSQKCNFINIPTDCPQRNERMGWAGDTHIFCHTALNNSSLKKFYERNLQAMRDLQTPEGQYPEIAPVGGGFGGITYECASIFMAWELYGQYGDIRTLEKFYPGMQKYMDYMKDKGLPGTKVNPAIGPLGDWLAPMGVDAGAQSSVDLVSNCFISECLGAMNKVALVLGKKEEAEEFATRKEKLNKLIHQTFYRPSEGIYSTGSQLDMCYPMLVGVVPDALYNTVRENMMAITEEKHKGHIAVGLVGVPILTEWAVRNKKVDFFYQILKKRDYPGYLYMIDNGATATWEYWSGERSRVHNCYNGIGTWFYQAVGGIRPDEAAPGYRHVYIDPQIPNGVTWAKTTKESPYGTIIVNWELKNRLLNLQVSVPSGTTATVCIPDAAVSCKMNKKKVSVEKKTIAVEEGNYDFVFDLNH